jgi:molybdate transport system substrate-binding protein
MDVAKERALVDETSEQQLVFLVNSINVPAGNPKGIHTLEDLLRPDVRVALANPESVCVGAYAVEILEKNFSPEQLEQFRSRNLVNYTDSCESVANAVSLKAVDAVVGWSVFEAWDPTRIETIDLEPDQLVRVAYIPIAVATTTTDSELARAFVEFVASDEARTVFKKHGYFVEEREAHEYVGSARELPVGGTYTVPRVWLGQ